MGHRSDERRCQFCEAMDGKIMTIDGNYHNQGDKFEGAEGGILSLDYEPIQHPPLHAGCRCSLIPVLMDD